jgi:hypothetical protein
MTLGVALRVRPKSWYSTCGTFGTLPLSDESREDKLLELPAPVRPGMFGTLPERLEKEEVWMG